MDRQLGSLVDALQQFDETPWGYGSANLRGTSLPAPPLSGAQKLNAMSSLGTFCLMTVAWNYLTWSSWNNIGLPRVIFRPAGESPLNIDQLENLLC
jgi:hypothetical protein